MQTNYTMENPENDRLLEVGKAYEAMPFTFQHWKAGFAIFFAYVIEAWELMIMIFIIGGIANDFGLDQIQTGTLMGSIYLGMIPGCLLWGKIIDKIGRKTSIVLSFILYGIISLISAFSVNYDMLFWTRFLAGAAFSGATVATFLYFEELLPVKSRGRAAVYLAAGWPIGTLIAVGIAYFFSDLGWHWVLGISSLGGLWFLVIKKLAPESPYWLVGKQRSDEAKAVLMQLSENKLEGLLSERELYVRQIKQGSFLQIFKGKLASVTMLQTLVNFCFSWGYWALFLWMPYMLAESKGFTFVSSLGFVVVAAVAQFPGFLASSWLTERYGRKKVMFTFVTLAAIGGFGFASSDTLSELLIYLIILSFFNLGAWGVWDVWMGELYPTAIRGAGYGFGMTAARVANWMAPSVIGAFLAANQSFLITNAFIASFLVITAIAVLFLKETEGEILH
ncbi:MFS transporter [Brevibacillus sp. NRS-1366]|uniref:MFS transporter n=1 Tax=Brevibacillus sp. NRS-1366 TaxID=3233899 RepID=UPI003D1DBACD